MDRQNAEKKGCGQSAVGCRDETAIGVILPRRPSVVVPTTDCHLPSASVHVYLLAVQALVLPGVEALYVLRAASGAGAGRRCLLAPPRLFDDHYRSIISGSAGNIRRGGISRDVLGLGCKRIIGRVLGLRGVGNSRYALGLRAIRISRCALRLWCGCITRRAGRIRGGAI